MSYSAQIPQFCLSNGNREALIIRWRAILLLGLQDYFTNENKYSKIITREIIDMFEGMIKAFAESLRIQVRNKGFIEIFDRVKNNDQVPDAKKQRLREINNSLSADELNSIRNIIRNPETHSLHLPSMPVESVMRCWRLFNEAVTICDESILAYAQSRPEFRDFLNLYAFFYRFVINRDYIDLRTIKIVEKPIVGKDQRGKFKELKIEHERTVSELIQYISDRGWLQ